MLHSPHASAYPMHHADIRKIVLLINPIACKGLALQYGEIALAEFKKLGIEVESYIGKSPEEAQAIATQAQRRKDIDALVLCGGDGLINLALQEHVHQKMPLGIIPAGTGNDTARTLGLPFDPAAAARVIAQGLVHEADVGKLIQGTDECYFASIACAGIDSLANDRANSMWWPKGKNRFNLATLIEVLRFQTIPVRLELAGGTVLEDNITVFAIGNTRSYGGGFQVCPFACLQDGLFDITFIPRMSRWRALMYLRRFNKGDVKGIVEAKAFRATKVQIQVPGISIYADGNARFKSNATAVVVPEAAHYIVPGPLCDANSHAH